MELDDRLYEQIQELSQEGDDLADEDDFDGAMQKYQQALGLLPGDKYIWEASTWLYAALGDTCYLDGQYEQGINYLMEARKCPDGLANPFILLRIGECFFELENIEKAREYLIQAYMLEGETIFEDEPEEYFAVIQDLV